MEQSTPDVEDVNTIQGVKSLADGIAVVNSSHESQQVPLLYINIEPNSLGVNGELNLLAIMLCYGPKYRRRLFLVDVNVLANQAFSTRGYYGASLRSILDSASYQKVFFDGVHDLQLMENACWPQERKTRHLQSFDPLVQSLLVHGMNRKRWLIDKFNGKWAYGGAEAQRRVDESQEDGYNPLASGRLRSPWSTEQHKELDYWREMSPGPLDLTLGSFST
ncbi:hypothetical protein FGLOB1_5799 [Fusarium globosum]|uniref:3'-5' exonuclease domain-containing protein n=1 Tax=Fusarium globosum TaxID=78864 RepID=A0A8H6DA39_9HYPO|nr:hypothetical protein FGLOB1_5799 [Fusarium globosum]